MNKIKKLKISGSILIVIIVIWSAYFFGITDNKGKSEEIKFKTFKVARGNIQSAISVDGKIVFDTWNLKFLNSGVVKKVNVKLGDTVKKDQVLAELDASSEIDKVAQMQAELNLAIATQSRLAKEGVDYKIRKKAYDAAKEKLDDEDDLYDEYVKEYGKSSTQALAQKIKVTAAEYDVKITKKQLQQVEENYRDAQYQIEKNEAAYRQSLQAYDDYKIISPVSDAIVAQINGTEGSVILNNNNSTTEPFIILANPKSYWFEAYVEDVEALRIKQDMKAYISLDAYPDDKLEGRVTFVSPVAELDANDLATYKVLIAINKTDRVLLGDMFGGVELVSEEVKDVIKVPSEAVISKNGNQYIIIKTANGFTEKQIQTGFTNGKEVEIIAGLGEDAEVVVVK